MNDSYESPIVLIIVSLVFFLADALINQVIYDDWTCMFKECVEVKNIKEKE